MRGLYAITADNFVSVEILVHNVEQVLVGGAAVIQYRDKQSSAKAREVIAVNLLAICQQYNAKLIINDDVTLAKAIHADGVHLGQDDMSLTQAREVLGKQKIIGVSCYGDIDRAKQAEQDGADYVAFGRFFPSVTKPSAAGIALELLINVRQQIGIPIVAIGGITAQNGAPLITAGADMLAVIDGIFGQADISLAARGITNLF